MSEEKTTRPRIFSARNMTVAMNHASSQKDLQQIIDIVTQYDYSTELTYEDMAVVLALALNAALSPSQLKEVSKKLPEAVKSNDALDLAKLEDLNFKLPARKWEEEVQTPDDQQRSLEAAWSLRWALQATHRQAVTALIVRMAFYEHTHVDDLVQLPKVLERMGYDEAEFSETVKMAKKKMAKAILKTPSLIDDDPKRLERLIFCAPTLNYLLLKDPLALKEGHGYELLRRTVYRIPDNPELQVLRPGLRALVARLASEAGSSFKREQIEYYSLIKIIGDKDDIFNLATRLASEVLTEEEEAAAIDALRALRREVELKKNKAKAGIKKRRRVS